MTDDELLALIDAEIDEHLKTQKLADVNSDQVADVVWAKAGGVPSTWLAIHTLVRTRISDRAKTPK